MRKGQLDWAETFADGSFCPGQKKGGIVSAKTPPWKGYEVGWWWSTAKVFLWENYLGLGVPVQKSR